MAKQMILSFDVDNQTLKRKDENKIVEKSKNYVHAIFFFTEEWDDTQKAAIIENGGMRFKVYLENNECDIPNRAVSHDGFTITIVGEDEEKNITITTTDLFIAVQKNNASDIQEEYIKNITSDTLDLTREGENCKIEIPSEYVTIEKLLQKLENYVDNESLEETLEDYAKETDLSIYATKQELNEKSKVVANPTLSGEEATLEGAEIDGIKYKVGGGSDVHLYKTTVTLYDIGVYEVYIEILSPSPTEFTKESFLQFLNDNDYCHSGTYVRGKVHIATGYEYSRNAYNKVNGVVYNQATSKIELIEITDAGSNRYTLQSIANIANHIVQIF